VVTELGLLDDPKLEAYVNRLGGRLARHAPQGNFEYRFAIVDQDVPNAFALPGGYIYVSRGLLLLANSEDELANVLAHEITHVAARHAAARQASIRGMPGPFQFFAQGHIAGYSRDQEREADRMGQNLAAVAGYDPSGMATFLKHLEFTERLKLGASRLPSFFDTHPTTSERVAAAASRARIASWQRSPGVAEDRSAYLHLVADLVIGTSASEGMFQGQRFVHPDLDFTIRFPDGWTTMNTHVAVGAVNRLKDAQIVLEGQGAGDDPQQAAAVFLGRPENEKLKISSVAPLRVGNLPAYRITGATPTPAGWLPITITWVARTDMVFRFTGLSTPAAAERFESSYLTVVRSFRPLPPSLRSAVRENRMELAEARAGESLAALSERTGNEWDLQTTAIFNDIFADAPLAAGQLVKISVSRPYGPHPEER